MSTTYIVGAGPVGLLTAALLQRTTSKEVVLFEKRASYTRTRMVALSPYLLAQEVSSYDVDPFDADNVRAIYNPDSLADLFASKRWIPGDVKEFLRDLGTDYVPLNTIEEAFAEFVSAGRPIERRQENVSIESLDEILREGDVVLDCSGRNSLTRDSLPSGRRDALFRQLAMTKKAHQGRRGVNEWHANTLEFVLEHALVVTFELSQTHVCDERCKFRGNEGNMDYRFLPSIRRTYSSGSKSNVTGVVHITPEDYERLPSTLSQEWLDANEDPIAQSINRFLTNHLIPLSGSEPENLAIITLPLNLYRARRFTNADYTWLGSVEGVPTFLLGDGAVGSPFHQSISLGFEGSIYLNWLMRDSLAVDHRMLEEYEAFMERQWMRVYMRSKAIKANKDVLANMHDQDHLLDMLHVY